MGLEDLRRQQNGLPPRRKCNNVFYWLLAFSGFLPVLFFFSCYEFIRLTSDFWSSFSFLDKGARYLVFFIVLIVVLYWCISRLIYWSDVKNVNFANRTDVMQWQYTGLVFMPLYVILRMKNTKCNKVPAVLYFLISFGSLVIIVLLIQIIF